MVGKENKYVPILWGRLAKYTCPDTEQLYDSNIDTISEQGAECADMFGFVEFAKVSIRYSYWIKPGETGT